jgi:hypothetical protein
VPHEQIGPYRRGQRCHTGANPCYLQGPMPENEFPKDTPQFGTAEYHGGAAVDVCKLCQQPIRGQYYRANTAMLCQGCAERERSQIPQDSHGAFVRGIIFGTGGFVVGMVLYAGFTILTGIEIGFVSLAVGWLVGKAIMMGSRGAGGRRYQIAAVLLTYAAVSLAAIPISIAIMAKNKTHTEQPVKTTQPAAQDSGQPGATGQNPGDSGTSRKESSPRRSVAGVLGLLALLGLASPFLGLTSGFSGVIGLVILLVGMQFAWKITAGVRVSIEGPFQASSAAKA